MIDLFDQKPEKHSLRYRIIMGILRFSIFFGIGWIIGQLIK